MEARIGVRVEVSEFAAHQEGVPRTAGIRRREPQSARAGNRDRARAFDDSRHREERIRKRCGGRRVRLLVELRVRIRRRRPRPRSAPLWKVQGGASQPEGTSTKSIR